MNDADDPFSAIFASLTPARLLQHPRATGEGVRVCVIDTGLDRRRLAERAASRGHSLEPIAGAVFREDVLEALPDEGRVSSPHGTTVADILLSLAPKVQLFSADVFGPMGSCESRVLIRAIRWAMDVGQCKVINLSLGIPEAKLQLQPRRQELLAVIEEAYFRDVILVAAANNDHPLSRSYPAVFSPSLLSVDKGEFRDPTEFVYRLNARIEFTAHGTGPSGSQPATSWAVPHLSAIVARLLSLKPTLKPFEIKALLYWMSERTAPDH